MSRAFVPDGFSWQALTEVNQGFAQIFTGRLRARPTDRGEHLVPSDIWRERPNPELYVDGRTSAIFRDP
jgi:hypothetical protein